MRATRTLITATLNLLTICNRLMQLYPRGRSPFTTQECVEVMHAAAILLRWNETDILDDD